MKSSNGFTHEFRKNKDLFFMVLPAILLILTLNYIPLSGLVLAFKNFRYNLGIFGSPWNGLENFRFLFASGVGWRITRNTMLYNVVNLLTSQGIAVIIAIFISEMNFLRYKKVCQSLIFLPYFISWVLAGTFVYNIFSDNVGVLNNVRRALGMEAINVYSMPEVWPIIINFANSWKWVGYNSIIFIAAITSIDPEIFEAADIDGANIFQKISHITIPSITPTIIIILLLQIGRILRGDFEMFYQIVGNTGQLFAITDVIDVYVFRSLLLNPNYGMTAAATFYQSILCFVIIVTVNHIVKKIEEDYALF
jgi:putative aldouronate transport system permease protein